jgi:hypothetical protein
MKGSTSSRVSETDIGGTSTGWKGYSKVTVRAVDIIRKELEPVEGEEMVMSFKHMATEACVLMHTGIFSIFLILVGSAGDSTRLVALLQDSFSSFSCWVPATAFN